MQIILSQIGTTLLNYDLVYDYWEIDLRMIEESLNLIFSLHYFKDAIVNLFWFSYLYFEWDKITHSNKTQISSPKTYS